MTFFLMAIAAITGILFQITISHILFSCGTPFPISYCNFRYVHNRELDEMILCVNEAVALSSLNFNANDTDGGESY